MRTRFAPSPTGRLHLGHALAAKEAFGFERCLLRIEDIDHTRCKADYTLGIYQDLDWLGFDWPLPVRVQSRHYIDYAKVVAELLERGLAYPCQLTRSELKAGERTDPNTELAPETFLKPFTHPDGSPNTKPARPEGREVDARATLMEWAQSSRPDPIIARKDIGVSYHIAVTHDDHIQGITHVVRGMDLFEETML